MFYDGGDDDDSTQVQPDDITKTAEEIGTKEPQDEPEPFSGEN